MPIRSSEWHSTRLSRIKRKVTNIHLRTIYIDGRFYQQPLTGVQRYARELIRSWDEMLADGVIDCERVRFEVLVPRRTEVPDFAKICVRRVGSLRGHAWAQIELPYWSRDGILFSPSNILPLASRPLTGVVTVHSVAHLSVREGYSFLFRRLYKTLVPRTIARAKAIIAVSEAERLNIVRFYPDAADRIAVVYHGVRAPSAVQPTRRALTWTEPPYALWVGTLSPLKNPQLAIEAVSRANAAINLRLLIAGGSYRGLRAAIPKPSRPTVPWVSFMGPVKSSLLDELYRNAFCLLVTSSYESFCFPAVEAMISGCPVITSDLPALREICGDAALYCRGDRAENFDDAIRRLAGDDALRQTLIQRGLRRARQFTWESCARSTLRVIESASARPLGDLQRNSSPRQVSSSAAQPQ